MYRLSGISLKVFHVFVIFNLVTILAQILFKGTLFSFLLKEQAKRRFRRFWLGSLFYPLEAGFIFRLCHFPSHLSKAHRIVIAGQCFFFRKKSNRDHDDGDEDNDDKDYDDDACCFHISKFYQRGPPMM